MRKVTMAIAIAAVLCGAGCDKLQRVAGGVASVANRTADDSRTDRDAVQVEDRADRADAVAAAQAVQATPGKSDPLLDAPQVGDLYAAKLSAISAVSFSEDGEKVRGDVFGLLKVVEVDGDNVVVITETSGWPNPRGARNDLRGDHSNIEWDEEERIVLKRSELPGMLANGDIIEARRL